MSLQIELDSFTKILAFASDLDIDFSISLWSKQRYINFDPLSSILPTADTWQTLNPSTLSADFSNLSYRHKKIYRFLHIIFCFVLLPHAQIMGDFCN